MNPTAIIIGASSGIGEALALELDANGYSLGLASRRTELLHQLAAKLKHNTHVREMDLADFDAAAVALRELIQEMKDVDLIVISAGTGFDNPALEWTPEANTILVNVTGFARVANVVVEYFEQRGHGHLAAITSIMAIRGHGDAPAYGASKAFMSNYLCSLRHRFRRKKLPIHVTEICPGYVDTKMAQGASLFWVAPVQKASKQIVRALKGRRSHVYITKRWRLIAWLLRICPDALYERV
ncbi:MAG: SDR family NAD(P)-dependent oxidoreductase [Pseudomonadota bacterium]|jgi:short-subunit dehydrogenase